jgi:hypothetical protein
MLHHNTTSDEVAYITGQILPDLRKADNKTGGKKGNFGVLLFQLKVPPQRNTHRSDPDADNTDGYHCHGLKVEIDMDFLIILQENFDDKIE